MKNYLLEAGNIHLSYYIEAADILNIKYEIVVPRLLARFEDNNKHWFIINTVTPLVNSPGKTIAARKDLTNIVLGKAGIPVPKQKILNSAQDAIEFFHENKDIVLKPTKGLGGKGVSILPSTITEVELSFRYSGGPGSIGETYVSGENYRLLTLVDEVIGIVKRLAPSVKGDGQSNIRKLIEETNPKIPIDDETKKELNKKNLTYESIPKEGETVYVRYNTNLTTGGSTQEYSKFAHPYYKELAVKAIKAVGLKLGGVDIIAQDITKPGPCVINEINYNPGLRIHYQVKEGEKVKVAIPIMKYIRDNEI